jgi:hypothetical protein
MQPNVGFSKSGGGTKGPAATSGGTTGTFGSAGPTGVPAPGGGTVPSPAASSGAAPKASPMAAAQAKVAAFATGAGAAAFKKISRAAVARGLSSRLANPDGIDQAGSSLCGPSVFVRRMAATDPVAYVTFVIDLYQTGQGHIGDLKAKAGDDLREYDPGGRIEPVDWIPIASLRDSDNWFFDYQDVNDATAGITMPSALESWFRKVGYRDIINETNVLLNKGEDCLRRASGLWAKDYWVCLFINADMLHEETPEHHESHSHSTTPDHWVALTSAVDISPDKASVKFTVFSWGKGHWAVPQTASDKLSLKEILNNFYGFVDVRH